MSNLLPPLDCSLNVAQILDFHITHENRGAAYSFPDEVGNTIEISHFELSRAAHRVAHLLRPQRRGLDGQVLAIVAQTDVLIYQTIVVGCIIAGLVPFPISHRNTTAAIFHLLKDTGSHRVLTTKCSGCLVETVATENAAYELTIEEIPLLGQIYPHLGHETPKHPFVPYPSHTTSISLDHVALYLHSSGSTGLPKSIPYTHKNLIHLGGNGPEVAIAELVELSPRLAVGHLPAFHSMALTAHIFFPILNGGTACLYPLSSTPTETITPIVSTAENALENARRANATGILTVPAFILEWHSPEDVAYLKTLNIVVRICRGPLASRIGDALFSQGANILPIYGATEFGIPTVVKRHQAEVDAGEWAWFRFNNRVNVRWEPQGDGTFECQLLTVPETYQVCVENLPDVKGYSTKDLFERHPTKPDLYKIVGRLDDVLIMANGEKTVPAPMEDVLGASSFITGAVMFGRERNQVGVLIEPNHKYELDPTDEQQLVKYRNLIWPVVAEANEVAPAFAQIYKEMILVTQPAKPMIRAPKGTVIKKPTIALYKQEIEDLYETIEASGNAGSDIDPPSSWHAEDLELWLITQASLVADKDIRGGRDLFDQGFDSLKATFLRHRIVGALRNSGAHETSAVQKITQNFVYAHPSIEDLANAIAAVVRGDANVSLNNAKAAVETTIAKYSEGLGTPLSLHHKRGSSSMSQVVLLTGSTGGLGSHILEILLRHPAIERVYTFNRPGRIPVSERQREAFVDRALDITLLVSEKLIYLEGDSAKENLGLPLDVWTTLRDTTTVIIHNAWTLDFNKTLSSFEPHVKGTRNLIDLARQSPTASGVRFLFTSSISSAQNWDQERGPFPEELQLDASVAIGNGYGESKYVSERILAASGLEATSFRIGQISGSASNGAWSTTDWVPAIVKSSIALGGFPSDPSGTIAWITPEAVSHTIVDAAMSTETPPFAINLVHPRPVSWDFIMSTLADTVHLPLIPFGEWVQQLQDRSTTATVQDIEKIPGIKLLDFFKTIIAGTGNIIFSMSNAQTVSESMRLLEPLCAEDAKRWMQYWKGFLA
ncbi:Acetyl-CoA synthetase-like protein [Mycena sanguinolenta]|uniref:Acetyl-CoA synthetase-like protein n=1 Tax=Mycena sanguinolenta TaxID=230812 RepID=A0A8H6XIF5_9AGAR|nr:Acetyl-CoA synthetase-like protein [Mycena sanguinolenta]